MRTGFVAACCAALLAAPATAAMDIKSMSRPMMPKGVQKRPHSHPDTLGWSYFDQYIDHYHPSVGTFKQRYWWDATHWKGPGSPVFVFNPGEDAADGYTGYLDNGTMPGLYAQEFGGAAIVIEHRYFGNSTPTRKLTAETMQYHTPFQAAFDMTYFAKTVNLDFANGEADALAGNAPWVLIGGSYSGALAAWTSQISPGVFWAYHASSAVVEAIYDFNDYYTPIEEALPRNCSSDLHAVISYVDSVLDKGNEADITALKTLFGLEMVTHHGDFAGTLAEPIRQFQGNESAVLEFCDFVETYANDGVVSSSHEGGIGLQAALKGYAAFVKKELAPSCRSDPASCDSYVSHPEWNDPDDYDDGGRQWNWMLCDWPAAWWQCGPPKTTANNIISTYFTPEWWQRKCPLMFPTVGNFTVGSSVGWTADHLNKYTGGWDADYERVIFASGNKDPWLYATPLSPARPGGPINATVKNDIAAFMVSDGAHVPDLILGTSPGEEAINELELRVMSGWLAQWKP